MVVVLDGVDSVKNDGLLSDRLGSLVQEQDEGKKRGGVIRFGFFFVAFLLEEELVGQKGEEGQLNYTKLIL